MDFWKAYRDRIKIKDLIYNYQISKPINPVYIFQQFPPSKAISKLPGVPHAYEPSVCISRLEVVELRHLRGLLSTFLQKIFHYSLDGPKNIAWQCYLPRNLEIKPVIWKCCWARKGSKMRIWSSTVRVNSEWLGSKQYKPQFEVVIKLYAVSYKLQIK